MRTAYGRSTLGLLAVALLASACGTDTSGNDMNAQVKDLTTPLVDATSSIDQSMPKMDLSMADLSMADMSMAPVDMSMQDMSVELPDMSAFVDGAVMGDAAVMSDGPAIVVDASMPDVAGFLDLSSTDLARPDIFMPGDIGIVDAQMDGPGQVADRPPCTGEPTVMCQTCLGMKCANQVIAAFGANWQTKDTGSTCDGVYACWCKCAANSPNDPNCRTACVQAKGQACLNAFNTLAACTAQSCALACM